MKNILEVKGREIGGNRPQICMPIVAKNYDDLMLEAGVMITQKPDLVEWRVDYFDDVDNMDKVLFALDSLSEKLCDFPILFTLRIDLEGGYKNIEQNYRISLLKEVIKSRKVDLIDFELINDENDIKDIINLAKENGVYVILSNHDFEKTPPKEEIVKRLVKAQEIGADIAKIAVMANSTDDLLELLQATYIMNQEYAKIPLVTMSMSGKGLLSRLAGGIFGSSITFAAGRDVSAPGQIPASELKNVLGIIEKNMN